MNTMKLALLIATLAFGVTVQAQTVPVQTHPAAGDAHPAVVGDTHPAAGNPHPAALGEIHPAFPNHSDDTNSVDTAVSQPSGTNTVVAANPIPPNDFSVPTFVPIPPDGNSGTTLSPSATIVSTNQLGQ